VYAVALELGDSSMKSDFASTAITGLYSGSQNPIDERLAGRLIRHLTLYIERRPLTDVFEGESEVTKIC
jgi:hypothetical protein